MRFSKVTENIGQITFLSESNLGSAGLKSWLWHLPSGLLHYFLYFTHIFPLIFTQPVLQHYDIKQTQRNRCLILDTKNTAKSRRSQTRIQGKVLCNSPSIKFKIITTSPIHKNPLIKV